jgi:imidazolonepropionase-like amidohydrolase
MHTHILADSATVEHQLLLFVTQGVTTIRNMDFGTGGNPENVERILRFRGRAAAGMLLSPRIYTSGPWGPVEYYDRKAGAGHHLTLDSVAVYVAAYKAKGYDHLKIHDETRVIVDSVAAAAHRVGIPVVGHLPDGSIYPYTYALSAGYKSIEHLDGYGREDIGVPAGESDSTTLDTMPLPALTAAAVATRRAGVWNCPTEAIVEKVLTMPSFRANYDHTRVRGIYRPLRHRIIQALQAAGAGLLLGTDFVGSVQDELAALVQAGLTPYQALVTGTRNVAVYFGTLAESGTVAVGKRADLVLLEGNPLRDIEQSRRIAGVMLGGRWLTRADLDRHLAAQLPN